MRDQRIGKFNRLRHWIETAGGRYSIFLIQADVRSI